MLMDHLSLKTLAQNIDLLLKHRQWSQEMLAKKSGVSQRTVSNMLNPGSTLKGPTLENIAMVAEVFGLDAWHLLIPNQPIEVLLSHSIEKIIACYTQVDAKSRENIERISENEVRYCEKLNDPTPKKLTWKNGHHD